METPGGSGIGFPICIAAPIYGPPECEAILKRSAIPDGERDELLLLIFGQNVFTLREWMVLQKTKKMRGS
jgi:hypothetical protein